MPRVGIINPPSTPWKAKVAIINPPALAWLACLLCPALAWSGLGLSCLPCLPCQACLPCLGLFQQQQPPWEGGVTRNKQWKKGYSVRLEQKSQKSFKKICSANFLERFLRFLFKTYQLSLFSIVYSRPPPPMAQAYGLSVAIPLFHASGLAMPGRIT